MDFKIDFSKIYWQLLVALSGGIFSIFSLIYNDKYIYYGFITFAFGVIALIFFLFFDWLGIVKDKQREDNIYFRLEHWSNIFLFILWIALVNLLFLGK